MIRLRFIRITGCLILGMIVGAVGQMKLIEEWLFCVLLTCAYVLAWKVDSITTGELL